MREQIRLHALRWLRPYDRRDEAKEKRCGGAVIEAGRSRVGARAWCPLGVACGVDEVNRAACAWGG